MDDGEQTIPGALLARVPAGFVPASFARTWRSVQEQNGVSLLAIGTATTHHTLELAD